MRSLLSPLCIPKKLGIALLFLSYYCSHQALAFGVGPASSSTRLTSVQYRSQKSSNKTLLLLAQKNKYPQNEELQQSHSKISQELLSASTLFVCLMTTTLPTIVHALEETMDDIEIAELPPVWVPIIFAIVILGGVGLLTASLGDVYTEEASLGLMSGAKAKKEKERSRSSYFKNK